MPCRPAMTQAEKPMPAPKLLLLDFDGTLADSRAWALEAVNAAAPRFGYAPLSADQAEVLRGQGTVAVLRAIGLRPWQIPRLAAHLREAASAAPPPALFPGVVELLKALQASGIRLALVTSNSEANVRRALGPTQAERIAYWAGDAALLGKARKFRTVLRHAGCRPAEAFAIGDETRDIAAARAVGIAVGAVIWGYATAEALAAAQPDALFTTMAEIAAFFGLQPIRAAPAGDTQAS